MNFSYKIAILSITLIVTNVHSQGCEKASKKYYKQYSKILSEVDNKIKKQKFEKLIKKFSDVPNTYFILAEMYQEESTNLYASNNFSAADKSLTKATEYYLLTLQKCQYYHASCFYQIAHNYLQIGQNEFAIPYLKAYLIFPENNLSLFKRNYRERKKNVQDLLKILENEKKLYENPVPFSPKKVKNVSTMLNEYFPMISPDNDLLFFTRKINRKNLGDIDDNIREEFTLSIKNNNTLEFDQGSPLPDPFNDGTFYNYGTATLSVDNKEMIICACKKEIVYNQNYLNCDLYTSSYKRSGKGGNDFSWSPLVNMGPNINTKDGWEAQPSLSSDGKTLFFTTIRKGSRDNDIYISERQEDGSWSKARPFDLINTDGKDKSPFFHQDGETLYFVSSCSPERLGLGGLDIFYIRKEGDSWTEPKNIGYPINSPDDELGLFVSTSGRIAYFSSLKEGMWNIYSFELYEEARPQEVIIIKGELKDEKGNPVTEAQIDIAYSESGETQKIKINGDDGKYAAVVKVDKSKKEDITISFNKENTAFNAKVIEHKEIIKATESNSNLLLETSTIEEIKPNKEYDLADLYFSTDSYTLNKKAINLLNQFANYLISNNSLKVEICGYTDNLGDAKANLTLSQNRSEAVRNYLISKGVEELRLTAKGFGEANPKFNNDTEDNRAKNRRTEFKIIK